MIFPNVCGFPKLGAPLNILNEIPLVDEILTNHRERIGAPYQAYRNHVCRVLNYCFALRQCEGDDEQKLIIAGSFHDLGIWPEQTIDYLAPSIALASDYLTETGRPEWADEIGRIIDLHHKIRVVRGDSSPLVELFRQADLVDVSLGWRRFGLSRSFVKQVSAAFPNHGFHKTLIRLGTKQLIRSPLNPLPMIKW